MRARPDIQTPIAFLTKRVRAPDEDDWGKLKRVLQYLKGTMYLKLTLTVDSLNTIRWWVDASYGVHADLKGHTGMMMSLGKGATMSFSRGQKLNCRSSTEAEIIGIDDAIPDIMWGKYFIEAQGYGVTSNVLLQDNKSTILLATNGRMSSSKRTKHIHHRFFLVKDLVDRGEIEVKYAPTDVMWSDVLTKPLSGRKFRELRAQLMNCPVDYDDEAERKLTHPGLLPKEESYGPPQGTRDCVRKAGVDEHRNDPLNGRGKTSLKRKVSWRSPLIQRRSVLRDDSFGDKENCSEIPDDVEKLRIACDRQARLIGQKISKQDLAKLRLAGARYRLAKNGGSIIPRGNQVPRQ